MRGAAFFYPEFTDDELPVLRLGSLKVSRAGRYRSGMSAVFARAAESRKDEMAVAR
jgi:hypothetical protein